MDKKEAYNNLIKYYSGESDTHSYILESWGVIKDLVFEKNPLEDRDCDSCDNDGDCMVTMLKCKGYSPNISIAVVKVKCVQCEVVKSIHANEIKAGDHPMCDTCFMPMVPVSATN